MIYFVPLNMNPMNVYMWLLVIHILLLRLPALRISSELQLRVLDYSQLVWEDCAIACTTLCDLNNTLINHFKSFKIHEFKSSLKYKFKISDLIEFQFFLTIHFERDRRPGTITMHQHSYIESVLEQFSWVIANPLEPRSM